MVIRASSGRQVEPLIADLASDSVLTRESAAARLTVIGERAVPRLLAVITSAEAATHARVAALHALEGIGDSRALDPALSLLDSSDPVLAVSAVAVLQTFLQSARGVDVLDRLTAIAVDRTRPRSIRLACIRAVRELAPATIAPLLDALGGDTDQAIALAAGLGAEAAVDPLQALREAAETLPDTPAPVRLALTEVGESAPLPLLQQLIERVRFREGAESGTARADWLALRSAAHAQLARRGSRLALYDLKETFETAREALPVELLGAMAELGDSSCLDAIAAAYTRSLEAGLTVDDWFLQRLTDVFRAIAAREQVTKRTAAGKKVVARWREAAGVLFA